MTVMRSALLLARLRAEGALAAADVAGIDLAAEAGEIGKRTVRIGATVRPGWADGHEPDPEGPVTSRLSAFPTGVLAAALALAWPDASTDPFPGEPLPPDAAEQLGVILDRDPKVISKYLGELRACELLTLGGDGRLRLGPAVAAWTPRTVTALRRYHHLLVVARGGRR